MLERTLTKVAYATNQDLNGSQNTALVTFVAMKPIVLHRYGVVADAAAGLLSPMRLKLRQTSVATGTAADLAGTALNPGGAVARGDGVYKVPDDRNTIPAGDTVTVSIETAAGGTSTGHVFLEYEELPFAGSLIDNMSESA